MEIDLPIVIDSTMLSTYRSCPRKFWAQYVVNAKGEDESVHLHAGAAWASAMEATRFAFFDHGMSEIEAEATGKAVLIDAWGDPLRFASETKNLRRMTDAFDYYHTNAFPLADDDAPPARIGGQLMVERSFAVPLGVRHPGGEEFVFVGRADAICDFAGGLWMLDDKTTGGSLGTMWESQWKRRGQFSGYVWAIREHGISIDGVLVRGIAIQKTQFKHQQVICPRPDHTVEEWLEQTRLCLDDMVSQFHSGAWRASLGESCTAYGKECAFMTACLSPQMRDSVMSMPRQKWDPQTRTMQTL